MNRREFLSTVGQWLLLTSAASATGCDSVRGRVAERARVESLTPFGQQGPLRTPSERALYPDLAVVSGADPGANTCGALQILGGIGRFVPKGARVLIKPNLTWARAPEYAVTTNPAVVGALVSLCRQAGAGEVIVYDKGGRPQKEALRESGIGEATRAAGGRVLLVTDDDFKMTDIPEGRVMKRWPLLQAVLDADVLINVPIAKHHELARLTMAMKNLMGVIGGDRTYMHTDFDTKIVDLATRVRPHLVVLDATRILVRNGPLGGRLEDVRTQRTIIASVNQVSVDAYGTRLFGMKPTDLPYLVNAARRGLGEIDLRKLDFGLGQT